jgi:hypothetical protein
MHLCKQLKVNSTQKNTVSKFLNQLQYPDQPDPVNLRSADSHPLLQWKGTQKEKCVSFQNPINF